MSTQADRARSRYRVLARVYDAFELRPFSRLRDEAVEALQLHEGETVLDIGCGTGLCLERLRLRVGGSGRVIGVDVSEAMLRRARGRVVRNGWSNVLLVQGDAARLPLAGRVFDAALSFYTHDVMTTREALTALVSQVKPGGRIVAVGGKRAEGLGGAALSLLVAAASVPFATRWRHLRVPWVHLGAFVPVDVVERLGGTAYLAVGTITAQAQAK